MDADPTEIAIICLLQADGRMSTAEIARRAKVSEPTVRKKLAGLIDRRLIRISAISDPRDLGFGVSVYIGLDVDRAQIKKAAAELARYPNVSSVVVATGPYDIIIEAAFRTIAHLYDFVLNEIKKIKGIKDSQSFFVLQRFKHAGLVGVANENDDMFAKTRLKTSLPKASR